MATTTTALPAEPIVTRASETSTYSMSPTETMRFLFTGAEGQPDFYEETAGRGDSPPLHRHDWASFELVLDGKLRYVIDGEEFTVGSGDFVYTPPGAVHTLVTLSETSHVIGFNVPGGQFEQMFIDALPMFVADPPDMAAVSEACARNGLEIVGPPLTIG